MPRTPVVRYQLQDASVLPHDIVAGDLGGRLAEPIHSGGSILHAGVVQKDHVGRDEADARALVRRRARSIDPEIRGGSRQLDDGAAIRGQR